MFGIKRKKQSQPATQLQTNTNNAAVLELKCAAVVRPAGEAGGSAAEYRDKGLVRVTGDRLVLQMKRETAEFRLKDVRLFSKADGKDVRLRLPSGNWQLFFRSMRDKQALCARFQKIAPKEPEEPAERSGNILLLEHHVKGMANGVPRHIMIQAYYDAQREQIVYDDGEKEERFPVPAHIKKNRNSLIAYLKTQETSIPYFLLTSV